MGFAHRFPTADHFSGPFLRAVLRAKGTISSSAFSE